MLAKFAFLSSLAAQCNHFFTRDVTGKFKKLNQFFVCLLSHSLDMGQEVTSVFTWDLNLGLSPGLNACAYLTSSVNQDGALCWFLV